MKEKGIKKLIKLLNESEDGFVSRFISYDGINRVFRLDNGQSFHYTLILSKEYGFIQRLVENNKIDRTYRKDLKYPYYIDDKERDLKGYEKSDLLVMLCSIQDDPIEFLVSILK